MYHFAFFPFVFLRFQFVTLSLNCLTYIPPFLLRSNDFAVPIPTYLHFFVPHRIISMSLSHLTSCVSVTHFVSLPVSCLPHVPRLHTHPFPPCLPPGGRRSRGRPVSAATVPAAPRGPVASARSRSRPRSRSPSRCPAARGLRWVTTGAGVRGGTQVALVGGAWRGVS